MDAPRSVAPSPDPLANAFALHRVMLVSKAVDEYRNLRAAETEVILWPKNRTARRRVARRRRIVLLATGIEWWPALAPLTKRERAKVRIAIRDVRAP